MNFVKKYFQTILNVVLVILLGICIYLLIQTKIETKQLKLEIEISNKHNEEIYSANIKILKENAILVDSLYREIKNSKVIKIVETQKYETVKKSAIKTNYTSDDITEWLKSVESSKRSK